MKSFLTKAHFQPHGRSSHANRWIFQRNKVLVEGESECFTEEEELTVAPASNDERRKQPYSKPTVEKQGEGGGQR